MKNIFYTTVLTCAVCFGTASAEDLASSGLVSSDNITVSQTDMKHLSDCLSSEMQNVSSRSVRACSKAIKASIPDFEIRSDLYARRGLLQLSAGRFEKASRDFDSADRLNGKHEFASLGQGFSAMMMKDYDVAEAYFMDCKDHEGTASLASYGLGMTYELMGDKTRALEAYEKAAKMRPGWSAPQDELKRLSGLL